MFSSITLLALAASGPLAPVQDGEAPAPPFSADDVGGAARIIGLDFTAEEIGLMMPDMIERLGLFQALRSRDLPNHVQPAGTFSPWIPGMAVAEEQRGMDLGELPKVTRPADLEDAAFWSIRELAALLRQTDVTSVELTQMYLARLRRLDASLHCVITFTEERALASAAKADERLAAGDDGSLLLGIPWGVKDLMACKGYRTTWGAAPFQDQVIDETAEVIERLDAEGAVLIAKLSVGALAWGDVWFGEKTRSPWDLSAGSSGSSAGSASATAAGGVAFALGTETLGSLVSPSVACATNTLRPSFGRVPRTGTMALCWSMDKVGPITRSLDDAQVVFRAIEGADPEDPFSRDGRVPATFAPQGQKNEQKPLRIGIPTGAFRGSPGVAAIRAELEGMGAELVDVELPRYPVQALLLTLGAEAATAFDELTRSGQDDELTRQIRNAWPNVFRVARTVPAVEYLRAQRIRSQLMADFHTAISGVDVLVHAPYGGGLLQITNLTGQPTVAAPFVPEAGPRKDGSPYTVCFTGQIDRDEELLAIARAWQRAHPKHQLRPPLDWLEPVLPESADPAEAVAKLDFLAGRWLAVNPNKTVNEEVWTRPRGNALIGTFRQVRRDSDTAFVELSQIAIEDGEVILRLRHLHGRLEVPESRKETSLFKLVSLTEKRVEFAGTEGAAGVTSVVYERTGATSLMQSIGFSAESGEKPFVTHYFLDED